MTTHVLLTLIPVNNTRARWQQLHVAYFGLYSAQWAELAAILIYASLKATTTTTNKTNNNDSNFIHMGLLKSDLPNLPKKV